MPTLIIEHGCRGLDGFKRTFKNRKAISISLFLFPIGGDCTYELNLRVDFALARRKWLYLILAWLFQNRTNNYDVLNEVETIYADFDYPSEKIESFGRYMPITNGYALSIHSKNENEERLFGNWRKYLEAAEVEFGNRKSE